MGLPAETLLILMPITLLLQGIAEVIKNLLFFFGLSQTQTIEHQEHVL